MLECRICGNEITSNRRTTCDEQECIKENARRVARQYAREYRRKNPNVIKGINQRSYEKNAAEWRENQRRGKELVKCEVCGRVFQIINGCHLRKHNITLEQYRHRFPWSSTITQEMRLSRAGGGLARALYHDYNGKEPDNHLYSFLVGVLLGDGYIELSNVNGRYAEGGANEDYLEWKFNFLSEYFPCTFQERLSAPHSISGERYLGWWIRTGVHPLFTRWHKYWYPDREKVVPFEMLNEFFSPFSLSVWFYDDGHMLSNGACLYTQGFSELEVTWLGQFLEDNYFLQSTIIKTNDTQWYIRIRKESLEIFRGILESYPVPGMEYKIYGNAREQKDSF